MVAAEALDDGRDLRVQLGERLLGRLGWSDVDQFVLTDVLICLLMDIRPLFTESGKEHGRRMHVGVVYPRSRD